MNGDIQHYTKEQITTAIELADFDSAMALWKARDWKTYSEMRDALITAIRHRTVGKIKLRHLQFIYFINKHLVQECSNKMSDREYFMKTN